MKGISKSFKFLSVAMSLICTAVFATVYVSDQTLPDSYQVVEGQVLSLNRAVPVEAEYKDTAESGEVVGQSSVGEEYSVNLKLLGLFPIKTAAVEVVDELYVVPSGEPFGVKIYTSGVIVVGFSSVDAKSGSVCPAEEAGLQEGDNIISVGGVAVNSNDDIAQVIENSGGNSVAMEIVRSGAAMTVSVTPAYSESETQYKAGVWVRDSSAGIGTLTFYSPTLGVVAGLGHGINDVDTDELLPLSSGELVKAEIFGLQKSVSGSPGELKGRFVDGIIGNLLINGETGVYGTTTAKVDGTNLIRIAMKQEVKTGEAEILCTIDGESPKSYKCEIEKVHFNDDNLTQNMIIRVTDSELIAKCGGIVQGMSGSPIIQDGKLVGAVTHVFVGEPTRGYAIFAETMYNTANSVDTLIDQSAP